MIFEPIEMRDKQGRPILLRNAEISDAEALIRYLRVISGETPYLVREPEEITLTREEEEAFVKKKKESERELLLVAMEGERHIGNCSFQSLGTNLRYSHRCQIGIALYREFCGRGIGRLMLEAVLKKAKETGYEQAELEVISGNERAISLYQSLGFREYGRFPNNVKYKNGTYADAVWMMKKL